MLTAKVPRTLNSDYVTQTVQDQAGRAIASIVAQPILNGNLITGLKVSANTQFSLQHNLGRKYKGYFVTRTQGASSMVLLREITSTLVDPSKIALLIPSATATIDVWVF